MNDDDRKLMVEIGKALKTQGDAILAMQKEKMGKAIVNNFSAPIPSPIQPPRVSVVDHEGTLNRFKMELKFEGGEMMTEQQRMDHSIRLLTEMEDLLREYGVTRLSGNYERTLKPISA